MTDDFYWKREKTNLNFSLQKLFSFPPNVSFWQGFTDEVQSFKEQTKSMSHDELITMVDDVQSSN